MAVYKPRRSGKTSKFYVCEFVINGKRIQESTKCTTKTPARAWEEERKRDLERAHAGLPVADRSGRIRSVAETIKPYLANYAISHRESSVAFAHTKLRNVERLSGGVLLADLTEDRVRQYIRTRQLERASGRTINMELGELSRAMGYPWSVLWPKVRKLEERKDVGRALLPEEQSRMLDAANALRSPIVRTVIPVLLLTGMRPGEALSLQWGQIDLLTLTITVGRAKTSNGTGRQIPIDSDLAEILTSHRKWFMQTFGDAKPEYHVFPFGSPQPTNPNRPITDVSSGWDLVRKIARVECRLHDLRHTFATQLAENNVPESTMLSLMGHMSRAMLERYSHIRMRAKRDAVAGVRLRPDLKRTESVPVKIPVLGDPASVQQPQTY